MSTDQVVPDSDMTASSQYDSTTAPSGGRLNYQTQYDDQGVTVTQIGGWAAAKLDQDQWLQVKFSQVFQITAVATQGQEDAANWVTSYKLQYSIDGSAWTDYSEVRHLFALFRQQRFAVAYICTMSLNYVIVLINALVCYLPAWR